MKATEVCLHGLFFLALSNSLAVGAQQRLASLDLDDVVGLLTKAEFDLPSQASALWQQDDGLPAPEHAEFAYEAARFLGQHAVTPPHDHGSTLWDVDKTASRQLKCLAYLAAGKQGRRGEVADLCAVQAMRLLWALPIQTGHRRSADRAFYAAASSLALLASIVQSDARADSAAHHVARQWLQTGMGQFATYGGSGDAKLQKAAEAVIEAAHLGSEASDIHGTDEAFFGQLDLSRPELHAVARHVESSEWRQAKEAYVKLLAERFSRRRGWPDVNFWKDADIAEADEICRNVFTIRAHMHRRYDYGKEVDWAKIIDNDIESRVWMNHHPWTTTLVNAYRETGDDKYVRHLCRLFSSWYETSPPPLKRSSAQWRTLEVGGRPGQRWGVVLLALAEHPVFRRECLFNMARSMLDHGKYLSMYAAGGGNWLQVESSGLACVALLFPEFKLSPLFYETAMNRLAWVNATAFLPDGFQSECSPGYHYFPLRGIASAMRLFLRRVTT
jgi:hypothetical protein